MLKPSSDSSDPATSIGGNRGLSISWSVKHDSLISKHRCGGSSGGAGGWRGASLF